LWSFDKDRQLAARQRFTGSWTPPTGDEGLVVHEDLMAVFRVPQWLWLVDDLEGETCPCRGVAGFAARR
jgi:hypothetical protein